MRAKATITLALAVVALIAAPPSAALAQIVGPGVYDWGYNAYGQLGNGNTTNSLTPLQVTGLSGLDVTAVSARTSVNAALTSTGSVYSWNNSHAPAPVAGLPAVNITAVAAGSDHFLALTGTGAVYAWGDNLEGQLGNGTTNVDPSPPAQVQGVGGVGTLSNITAVGAGGNHSLAVASTGAVYAWGFNDYGQLGNGTTTNSSTPVPVTGLSGVDVTAVAGGQVHSLALTSTGSVYAWGRNADGELGNGTTTDSSRPVLVTGLSGVHVTAVAAGGFDSMALSSAGGVYTWGETSLSALLVSFPANGSATVVSISAGYDSSFALESDGSLWAWGGNEYGQYGNGTTTSSPTPIEVYAPTGGYGISVFAEGEDAQQSLAVVTAVPEPGSLALVSGAVAAAAGWAARRRRIATRPTAPDPAHPTPKWRTASR